MYIMDLYDVLNDIASDSKHRRHNKRSKTIDRSESEFELLSKLEASDNLIFELKKQNKDNINMMKSTYENLESSHTQEINAIASQIDKIENTHKQNQNAISVMYEQQMKELTIELEKQININKRLNNDLRIKRIPDLIDEKEHQIKRLEKEDRATAKKKVKEERLSKLTKLPTRRENNLHKLKG